MQSNTSLNDTISVTVSGSYYNRFIAHPLFNRSTNRASGSKNVTIRDTFALLRTAIPITEAERTIAQANVTYAQSEISLLNKEFLNAKYISVKRKSRLGELRRFEQLERGLLAPIRKLSVEVLQIILQLAHYYSRVHCGSDCSILFPLVATQVCSYWRMTAHSTPSLWTDISFRFTSKNLGYGKLIEYCLQYSKQMPLSLSFDSAIVQGPELLGDSCVRALGQNAHRWQDVNFNRGDFATVLFAAIPEGVILETLQFLRLEGLYYTETTIKVTPKLSVLCIACYAWTADDSNVHVTIEYAPNLTHLELDFMHHPSAAITGLDWSLIQRFEARDVKFEPHEFNHILECMPHLLYLELDSAEIGTMGSTTLPYLQFLSIESYMWEGDILNALKTPRLKGLYINGCRFNENSLTKTMVEFARRSKFKLEELSVSIDAIDDSWLIPEFTNVKTLDLHCWSVNKESTWKSIKCLMFESEPSPKYIFPMLENLIISNLDVPPPNTEWAVTTLVDMLKSRLVHLEETATRGYLKYVQVCFNSALSGEEGQICSEFKESELVRNSGAYVEIADEVEWYMSIK